MAITALCSCGETIEFETEEQYYGLVRRHIVPLAAEKHRLIRFQPATRGTPIRPSKRAFGK